MPDDQEKVTGLEQSLNRHLGGCF